MSKNRAVYCCQKCGATYKKWQGRCTECNEWSTIVVENVEPSFYTKKASKGKLDIFNIDAYNSTVDRTPLGITEFDRVLGGGLVKGSVTLIGGNPGIGKSTLLLQVAYKFSQLNKMCLYVSGEESLEQIKLRAKRLNTIDTNIKVATATLLKDITATLEHNREFELVIIDSIQTLYHDEIDSAPGTVSQVRACAFELIRIAKSRDIAVILVGHVTKEGQIAGPKVLEHMVDTVLYFDETNEFRIIRSVKNRFGAANEMGIFEMTNEGLSEVANPSSIFLPQSDRNISGSTIYAGMEGTRPILLEIQALVVPSFLATPRRAVVGWDTNRLAMIIAILNARYGINLLDKEVYLNVTGGLKIIEPGADLAVIAALISAVGNLSIDSRTIFIGEVGLSGELRQVPYLEARLGEALKLGFEKAIIPKMTKKSTCHIGQISLSHINELKDILYK